MNENLRTKVVVIGGGPGGYAAAFLAADLGMQVTLVDLEKHPGGVCLYRGCIPSKALLHIAKVVAEARAAREWGVEFGDPQFDLSKIRSWKQSVVEHQVGGLGQLAKMRKIQYIQGKATFVNTHSVRIELVQGGNMLLEFEQAILATGSRPAHIPIFSFTSERVIDSTTALELPEVPKKMLVVGGGYIGLELGTVYSTLGAKVAVVEMMPGLLPGADRDLVRVLEKRAQTLFDPIMLNTKVVAAEKKKQGILVKFEARDGGASEDIYDRVLVSVGRKPNSLGLGLENTRVETDERGFVKIDRQCRTAEPNIFAIGDVAGEPMLAHKASHEGRVAAEVIAGHKVEFQAQAIPAVVFTDPEIAWCGLTENEAKARSIPIEVARFPWAASGRNTTLGRSDGVTKLLIDPATQRVLGVGIAGSGAGELIAEGVLAVEMAALASDVKLSIHPHPTLSETIMEAAEVFFGQSTHVYRPKRPSPGDNKTE